MKTTRSVITISYLVTKVALQRGYEPAANAELNHLLMKYTHLLLVNEYSHPQNNQGCHKQHWDGHKDNPRACLMQEMMGRYWLLIMSQPPLLNELGSWVCIRLWSCLRSDWLPSTVKHCPCAATGKANVNWCLNSIFDRQHGLSLSYICRRHVYQNAQPNSKSLINDAKKNVDEKGSSNSTSLWIIERPWMEYVSPSKVYLPSGTWCTSILLMLTLPYCLNCSGDQYQRESVGELLHVKLRVEN